MSMHVKMLMSVSIMRVLMHMHMIPKSLVQAPKANSDEHNPDQPFRPFRKRMNRKHFP
jgi:hypothetical protein